MPQMSPLSWTTIFLMLLLTITTVISSMKNQSPKSESKQLFKKSENKMKW